MTLHRMEWRLQTFHTPGWFHHTCPNSSLEYCTTLIRNTGTHWSPGETRPLVNTHCSVAIFYGRFFIFWGALLPRGWEKGASCTRWLLQHFQRLVRMLVVANVAVFDLFTFSSTLVALRALGPQLRALPRRPF